MWGWGEEEGRGRRVRTRIEVMGKKMSCEGGGVNEGVISSPDDWAPAEVS